MSLNVYEIITERIIASLEKGVVPWHQTWQTRSPRNLISKKPYKGINVFLLAAMGYPSAYWMTYRQCVGKGGQVIKGEHSTPVIFWKMFEDRKDPTKKIPILRYYNVFNVKQCEGIEVPLEAERAPFQPIQEAERIVEGYGLRGPTVVHGGDRAFYSPTTDQLTMPPQESFESEEAYYSTRFHEMAHSSGHKSRLNREGVTNPIKFGSHDYSVEELVAEMTASFLCAEAGILDSTLDNSTAYIAHWVSKLKSEPKWVISAGAAASKAADYILNRSKEEEQEGEENS